jgi:N-acetylglutamate synthase/N-acetylornithine aminotransferase
MVSVDGDTSTNDMVSIMANGLAGNKPITEQGKAFDAFCEALHSVTAYLCRMIAADGEGATKLLECSVVGAKDKKNAKIVAKSEGTDPAAVVFDTLVAAKKHNSDVIICDTAGRLHNKKNLMEELAKMSRIIKRELPDASVESLLVLDAATGQNAVNQAREFAKVS